MGDNIWNRIGISFKNEDGRWKIKMGPSPAKTKTPDEILQEIVGVFTLTGDRMKAYGEIWNILRENKLLK